MFFTKLLSSTGCFCALVTLTACGQGLPMSDGESPSLGSAEASDLKEVFLQPPIATASLTEPSNPTPPEPIVDAQTTANNQSPPTDSTLVETSLPSPIAPAITSPDSVQTPAQDIDKKDVASESDVTSESDVVTTADTVNAATVQLNPPAISEIQIDNNDKTLTVVLSQDTSPNVVLDYHLASFPQASDDSTRSNDLGDSSGVGGQLTYTFTDLPNGQYSVYGRVYYSFTNFSEGGSSLVANGQYVDFSAQVDIPVPEENYITIGNQPGDATCLALGDNSVPFGSAALSDWGNWLGGDPRYFIGNEFLATENDAQFGKVLRHKFVPNFKGTEWVAMGANIAGSRTYRVVQSIFFEQGWDWGGEIYQGGKLGFGLGSGTYPTGGTDDPKGFTARLGWRGNRDGTAKLIVYSYAADRSTEYGEDLFIGDDSAPIGQWIEIVYEITVNSSIHVSDGSLRAWIDGELKLEKYNMGWQLDGSQPSIDSLFYMGMYGGHGWAWSPDGTTHMKLGDICWAPVVNGYSGIDPDAGITKVDPADRNSILLNDDLGLSQPDEIGAAKSKILGMIGQTTLQLNLTADSPLFEMTDALNRATKSLNKLAEDISKVSIDYIPKYSMDNIQSAYDSLEAAQEVTTQANPSIHAEISTYFNMLRFLTVEATSLSLQAVRLKNLQSGCDTNNSTNYCLNNNALIEEADRLQNNLSLETEYDKDSFFSIAKQIWSTTSEFEL